MNHYRNFTRRSIILIAGLFYFSVGLATESTIDEELTADQTKLVQQQFEPLFEQVTSKLSTDKQRYLDDPIAYHEFVVQTLQPRWDVSSTTSALIGRERFGLLGQSDRQEVVQAVTDTLIRYAFEGLEHYSGQQFRIVDVVLNQQASLGWVQVLMVSPVIPDIILDVLIKQTEPNEWKAVDVRFQGITYVSVKKHQFRETIEERGIKTLIADLQTKNNQYFAELCAKAKRSGSAPCIRKSAQ